MNRQVHPGALAAEIDQQVHGFTRGWGDHCFGPEEHEHAVREWEAFRLSQIPGLKFSDRPRYVLVPAVREGNLVKFSPSLGGMEWDEDRWDEVEPFLRKCGNGWTKLEVAQIPEGWNYKDIVPTHVHSVHDEPNPRLYGLNGGQIWQPWNDGNAGIWSESLCRTMEARLTLLYDTTARNEREVIVRARLQYHLEQGGNPRAYLEHVEGLVERWQKTPPLISFGGTWNRQVKPVPNAHLLVRYMREWLSQAMKAPAPVKPERNTDPKHMEAKELDTRFRELSTMLLNVWDGNALYRLGEKLREAYEVADDYEGGNLLEPHTKLDDHLGKCSSAAIAEIDASLAAIPCNEYSRLKFSSLLSGEPTPWGAPFDVTSRAKTFTDNLKFLVRNSDYEDDVATDIEYREGVTARLLFQGRMLKAEAERWENVRGGLMLHVLRVFQHLVDAGMKWGTGNVHTSAKDTDKANSKPTPPPPLRTMAERLDAKRGAREAFDTVLLIDGSTNKDGQWILTGRKGRAEVVAAWDAVVEIFGVEGYAKEEKSDKTLSVALREYIPGLTIGERPNKLRNTSKGSAYAKAWVSCERYLKERRERIIAERSDMSE